MAPRARKRPRWDPTEFIGRFLIVDDDRSWAEGFAVTLRESRPVDFAGTTHDADRLLAGPHPHVALVIDVVLPGHNGLVYLGELRERGIAAPALLVTAIEEVDRLVHLRSSALGARVVHKRDALDAPADYGAVLDAFVRAALDYEHTVLGPRAALFDLSGGSITLAEMQVAELRLEGWSNADVAEELALSEKTVRNHVNHLLAKCGASGGMAALRELVARRERARRRSS